MEILGTNVMRGPNYWSTYRKQLIVMKLDLQEAEETPTNKIDGFAERIEALMPSLYEHRCSERKPGGFFERIRRGTWLGHVIEHIALEIQSLAGMPCGFGRTRSAGSKGVYNVVFAYQVESAGLYAAKAAVRIADALRKNEPYNLDENIQALIAINKNEGIGPSTQSILNAAKRRGIPYKRLDNNSFVMLGQGVNQKLIEATITSATSSVGADIASDKEATKRLLAKNFVPVPEGSIVNHIDELKQAISETDFPLVIKPLNGNQGRGITTCIKTEDEAINAFEKAQQISKNVIVERFINGMDFRFLVINYKLEAVAKRTPAMVMGDDHSTIQQLIDKTNSDPNRGEGHERTLTTIKVDAQTRSILERKNLTLDSFLPYGEVLFLKDTANLSTGGTARDVTASVHPQNIFLAERIARLMNLNICGIDIVAEDATKPITKQTGAVVEVNAGPGFRMHLAPTQGLPRNVGEAVVKMLYPNGTSSRIPIVAVTGTNGKTTTTRLIAHLDYVHNTDGFKQLKDFMQKTNATIKTGVIGCAGDRRDEDIRMMGKYAAEIFDEIIIRHDENTRGRTTEELTQLLNEGIRSVKPEMETTIISDEIEALAYAIEHAQKGSFIVLSSDKIQKSIEYVSALQQHTNELATANQF